MADIHGSPAAAAQNPQAVSPGTAPVPYQGADQSPEPPDYAVSLQLTDAGREVMDFPGASMSTVVESAAAHDLAAGTADAPYYAGPLVPVNAAGDPDPGGRDIVSGTVAGAVDARTAWWRELESDIQPQGSTYGDLMQFPAGPLDPGSGVGNTMPSGSFYDPVREYTTDPDPGQQAPPQ